MGTVPISQSREDPLSKRLIALSVIGVGIVSVSGQVALFRELLSLMEGNELVLSVGMCLWLFIGGIGSLLAKFLIPRLKIYIGLCILSGILPPYLLFLSRLLYSKFFVLGSTPGLWASLLLYLIVLGPYALLIGLLLPYAQKISWIRGAGLEATEVYVVDNIGDIIGAFLISLLLISNLKILSSLLISGSLLIVILYLLCLRSKDCLSLLLLIVSTFILFLPLKIDLDKKTVSFNYPNLKQYVDSPYGRIAVTESMKEITIWESGIPYIFPGDVVNAEEKIHYPLSQIEEVEEILLISGYSLETISELSKYNPKAVDYVELDPMLINVAKANNVIKYENWLSIYPQDAKKFVHTTKRKYSAVIMDLPKPDTLQLSRLYSLEFFRGVKDILSEKGIFSFSMEYNRNYQSPYQRQTINILISTLKAVFKDFIMIPGERLYVLASDSKLSWDIPSLLKQKGIRTQFIQSHYYGNVKEERVEALRSGLTYLPPNRILDTFLMRSVLYEWFSKVGLNPLLIFSAVTLLMFFFLGAFMKTGEFPMFSTGFLLMGAEILVIYLFQVVHGYAYIAFSLLIGAFLFGLLPGALIGYRVGRGQRAYLILTEIILLLLSSLLLLSMVTGHFRWSPFSFMSFGFLLSLVGGAQFPILASLNLPQNIPYRLFGADLIGAGLGVMVIGGLLAPFLGMLAALSLLMAIKLISIIVTLWKG